MSKTDRQELRDLWAARLVEFDASGQTIVSWCKERGLKPHQLQYWLAKSPSRCSRVLTLIPFQVVCLYFATVSVTS